MWFLRRCSGARAGLSFAGFAALAACTSPASALRPAGRAAADIAELLVWMVAGGAIVWLAMVALMAYAAAARPDRHRSRLARALIVGLGVWLPLALLTPLLIYGLWMLPPLLAVAPEGSTTVVVTGEQWWWRIEYRRPGGTTVALANEVHLPVGRPVQFLLRTEDVIHSFWIPSLGGKVDMIPGRENRLMLEATERGVFRGVCAEYCGTAHALMAFDAVVEGPAEFERWLAAQAEPAEPPTSPPARAGAEAFIANGCGACHTVRGTGADGVLGPDLTHVGGRLSIGAGILSTSVDGFARWLLATERLKPGVHMPTFSMLPKDEVAVLASYLESLK